MSPNQVAQAGAIFLSDESVAAPARTSVEDNRGCFPRPGAGQMLTQPVTQRARPSSRTLVHDEREWAQNNATCD